MVKIVKSYVPAPLVIYSEHLINTDILQRLSFSTITQNQIFNHDIINAYTKVNKVESSGEYSRNGNIIHIWIQNTQYVIRIELFDNIIDNIALVNNITLKKESDLNQVILINSEISNVIFEYDIQNTYKNIINFYTNKDILENEKYFPLPIYANKEILWQIDVLRYAQNDFQMFYYGQSEKSFKEKIENTINFLTEFSLPNTENKQIHLSDKITPQQAKKFLNNIQYITDNTADKGFYSYENKIVVITDQEILGTLYYKSKIHNPNVSKLFDGEIKINDFVVHDLHGVGIYKGIVIKKIEGQENDYILIEYLDNDQLFVPYEQRHKIAKYIGEGGLPKLTHLGSNEWENIKKQAKKNIEEIADELLDLYTRRELSKGIKYEIDNTHDLYDKLIADFEYEDTPDQKKTSLEILDDMASEKPMDRLLVGDVGFGKTEMAVRAAFIAVLNKKQVLVLAPTTILVSQLYKVFCNRLSHLGVIIEKVSRFEGNKKNIQTIENANNNKIDIIIGTHRLLSDDVNIINLGLLIIDEEQRFGVQQKEKIKNLKSNIDVLCMTATPIPRTLQMSLTGIRDISVITTPPPNRLPVITRLINRNEIYEKIQQELDRDGQVFIIHNNISTIYTLENKVKEKLPNAKIIVGHAKMSGNKLENVMLDFSNKKYNVLIATTIIENGIDIPTVNTMIIDDAQTFGLSQLHQLRGRVGRSNIQAYCYLIVPYTLTESDIYKNSIQKLPKQQSIKYSKKSNKNTTLDGIERIKAIMEFQSLGSGFHIASRDLEIRGSGSMLSSAQSGHINTIGYEMYLRMLYNEIEKRKNK